MPLAVALVDDAFHVVVVVDPGHADVVAQHDVEIARGNLEELRQENAGPGVEPHEDRDAVGRLSPQGGIHPLLGVHGPSSGTWNSCSAVVIDSTAAIYRQYNARRQPRKARREPRCAPPSCWWKRLETSCLSPYTEIKGCIGATSMVDETRPSSNSPAKLMTPAADNAPDWRSVLDGSVGAGFGRHRSPHPR